MTQATMVMVIDADTTPDDLTRALRDGCTIEDVDGLDLTDLYCPHCSDSAWLGDSWSGTQLDEVQRISKLFSEMHEQSECGAN